MSEEEPPRPVRAAVKLLFFPLLLAFEACIDVIKFAPGMVLARVIFEHS